MRILIASAFLQLLLLNTFAQTPVAIKDVTVIDMAKMANPTSKSKMTVIVHAGRITNIGRSLKIPKAARVIEGRGKFLIPGLWDMHSHFFFDGVRDSFMTLVIANGVTGVRDMGGEQTEQLGAIRSGVADGKLVGPRIVAAGPLVDGPKPVFPFSIAVSNPDEGRTAVQTLKAKGVDFVKVYSLLPRDSYFAIAEEAKKQNMPFAGHIPVGVTATEASDAGQKSVEHIRIYLDVSSDEQALRKERLEAEEKGPAESNKIRAAQSTRILATFDPEKVRQLANRFAKNGTWFVPTLTVHKNLAFIHDAALTSDPRLRYVPQPLRDYWTMQRKSTPEAAAKVGQLFIPKDLQLVGLMHKGGAKILAGSDTMNPYVLPGFSLHDELALLVEAGLTPFEALKAATIDPAIFLNMDRDLGTVEKGKLADLVLLDADPIADIRNTTKINTVIANGRVFDRSALNALLLAAEKSAAPRPASSPVPGSN